MARAGRIWLGMAVLTAAALPAPVAWAGDSGVAEPTVVLPADARASTSAADRSSWIIGLEPGARAEAIARRYGARAASRPLGSWVVSRAKAGRLADALRDAGSLRYAEPNALRRSRAVQLDPLMGTPFGYWRSAVVSPNTNPPPPGASGALLYVIDSPGDPTHPELQGGGIRIRGDAGPIDGHGVTVTSVAAAPSNGQGITGIWPGGNVILHGLSGLGGDDGLACDDEVRAIEAAIAAGAKVINMSFGAAGPPCNAEAEVMQRVVSKNIIPVAAAGNEFAEGNPLEFPASLPHVITASAVDQNGASSFFSNANAAIDLAAPGENMVAAIPVARDSDGTPDGYEVTQGTSFSSPIIAAAMAWVRTVRPGLTRDQIGQVFKQTAKDVDRRGFDANTGFGLINIDRALTARAPRDDAGEPNDDIRFVNGRTLKAKKPIFGTSSRQKTVRGHIDRQEDPEDVFRVRLAPGRRVKVSVTGINGDPDLEVYRPGTRTVNGNAGLVDRQSTGGGDSITFRNSSRRAQTFYVGVFHNVTEDVATDSDYKLTVTRLRRR